MKRSSFSSIRRWMWAVRAENSSSTTSGTWAISAMPFTHRFPIDAEAGGELRAQGGVIDRRDGALVHLERSGV